MINHVRTLLRNLPADSAEQASPYGAYVPPSFVRRRCDIEIDDYLLAVLGHQPDKAYRNYRLMQLMGLLHSSDLREDVIAADSRLTYWPPRDNWWLFPEDPVGVESQASNSGHLAITSSVLAADTVRGRSQYDFQIEVVTGPLVKIVDRATSNLETSLLAITESGRSVEFRLGVGVRFRLVNPAIGDRWRVSWMARPGGVLLPQLMDLVEDSLTSSRVRKLLFLGDTDLERWGSVVNSSASALTRAAAWLLSIARHIESSPPAS